MTHNDTLSSTMTHFDTPDLYFFSGSVPIN